MKYKQLVKQRAGVTLGETHNTLFSFVIARNGNGRPYQGYGNRTGARRWTRAQVEELHKDELWQDLYHNYILGAHKPKVRTIRLLGVWLSLSIVHEDATLQDQTATKEDQMVAFSHFSTK